jgi:hypothetical protein
MSKIEGELNFDVQCHGGQKCTFGTALQTAQTVSPSHLNKCLKKYHTSCQLEAAFFSRCKKIYMQTYNFWSTTIKLRKYHNNGRHLAANRLICVENTSCGVRDMQFQSLKKINKL